MADCARGRSVRYLRVQLNAVLGSSYGAIPNFATEKEQKRNFLDFNDVTLVVVYIKSERFVKSTCLQQDLFDMTRVTQSSCLFLIHRYK